MKCHHCGSCDNKVIESRDVAEGEAIRRRRECLACGHRFTTYERLERPTLVVVKKGGARQIFNRDKLLAGLQHACEKTPVTNMQLENFVARIERSLYDRGEPEIASADIGEMVMQGLQQMNEVAYVRFASVYRHFKDITGFEQELTRMRESKKDTGQPAKELSQANK